MKKILVAIDGRVNGNLFDFACFIANLTGSNLIGVFLKKEETSSLPPPEIIPGHGTTAEENVQLFDENIRRFKEACINRGANCSIHVDEGIPVADIIKESRFADLLIVDPAMSLSEKPEETPTAFIKEVLSRSECPVLLAPFSFYGIDEILFAYDGSPACVFAIKQFTYLFPELADKKITILQVNEITGDESFVEKEKIEELLQLHYSGIGFQLLHGQPGDELFRYLLGKKNIFLVMGAFGRSMLSVFFKHSTAEVIIKTINLPLFIAHHK